MDLSCKICFEAFTTNDLQRPRSLPCGHSLCGVCATRLLVGGQLKCPLCQRSYDYQCLEDVGINHELEDIIERVASILASAQSPSANSHPWTIPKAAPAPTGPKLHYGICENHGNYKVHHCQTHDVFMCSDCAVAYHMEAECRRIPIEKVLSNKKVDLCKKVNSHMSLLQGTFSTLKDTELKIKTQVEELQSKVDKLQLEIKALNKQMDISKNSASKCTDLIKDCEAQQKKTQASITKIQSLTTFHELNNETQGIESSGHEAQELTKEVQEILKKQGFEGNFPLGNFSSLVSGKDTYATHTHEGNQRWGHIISKDGHILMQNFTSNKPPSGANVINLNDVVKQLSSPRHVYLSFSTQSGGTALGMVIIRINEVAQSQRCAQKLVDLCIGKTGVGYAGGTRVGVYDKGRDTEYFYSFREETDTMLHKFLEVTENVIHKRGLVVVSEVTGFNFHILTQSDPTYTWDGAAIGEVVSGLSVLEKIISDNLVSGVSRSSKVIISETGLVID